MKKAKIFFTALTVLAVVGGALAFKAKTQSWFAFCDTFSLVCTKNSFNALQTTLQGTLAVNYDEYGKPCIIKDGTITCTTLVATAP